MAAARRSCVACDCKDSVAYVCRGSHGLDEADHRDPGSSSLLFRPVKLGSIIEVLRPELARSNRQLWGSVERLVGISRVQHSRKRKKSCESQSSSRNYRHHSHRIGSGNGLLDAARCPCQFFSRRGDFAGTPCGTTRRTPKLCAPCVRLSRSVGNTRWPALNRTGYGAVCLLPSGWICVIGKVRQQDVIRPRHPAAIVP